LPEEPDGALLKGKEEIFLDYIKILCEALELKRLPQVIFCDGYTPMGPDAKACIDSASWTIWVSCIHLRMMSFEEIKKTAGHELNHLFIGPHNAEFRNKLNELLVATWEPEFTSGLKVIDGGKEVEKPEKQPEKEIDKTECNRHSCNTTTGLECCSYCGGYYCEEHIKPLPPLLPNFDNPEEFIEWKYREKFHPCPPFYNFLVKKHEDLIKNIEEKFNKMNALKIKRLNVITNSEPFPTVPLKSLVTNEPDISLSKNDEKNEYKKIGSFFKKCSYCSQESINLTECKYCKELFCKNHIQPKTFNEYPKSKEGHLCNSYTKQQKKGNKQKQEKWMANRSKWTDEEINEFNRFHKKLEERILRDEPVDNLEKPVGYSEWAKEQFTFRDKRSICREKLNGSKLKYRWNNFKYNLRRKTHFKVGFSAGLLLGLFIPLCVALIVIYLLEPGISYLPQFYGTGNTIQLILLFLILPAEVNSIVPWIAWIASGFAGGFISQRILIPFIPMYLIIWLILFLVQGNLLFQQLSMFWTLGLEQIIIQKIAVNIIFSLLAFGFGGWIGASIVRR